MKYESLNDHENDTIVLLSFFFFLFLYTLLYKYNETPLILIFSPRGTGDTRVQIYAHACSQCVHVVIPRYSTLRRERDRVRK